MRFAFGTMGMAPDRFWNMSMRELSAVLAAYGSAGADACISRDSFRQLMQTFPDED